MRWFERRMWTFDLETTAPDPEEARIVTAVVAEVGGGVETVEHSWLADPGVEIPEGATEVHGISTEKAREEGRPVAEVAAEVAEAIGRRDEESALVIFNAPYDLTVLDRELRRHHIGRIEDLGQLLVVDPFKMDRWLHRFRRGKRTLGAMCEHYGIELGDDAHDAGADALAVARLAWVLATRGTVVRRARYPKEVAELEQMLAQWERVRHDLPALHEAQIGWAEEQAIGLADYFRREGKYEEADSVKTTWPWHPWEG